MQVCDVINLTLVNNTETKQTSGIFEQPDSGVNNFSAARTEHPRWNDGNGVYGIDLLNFKALPSGNRSNTGAYQNIGAYGWIWTNSATPPFGAVALRISYNSETISAPNPNFENGFSVRCLRNLIDNEALLEDGTIIENAYTDIDGNIYNAVKIGTQVWINSNLKVTKYADGSPITTGLNDTDWASNLNGAYAVYPYVGYMNSEAEMIASYGLLYNWYAVGYHNLITAGDHNWHVPDYGELSTLLDYLTVNYTNYAAGTILKSYWQVNSPYIVESIAVTNETPDSNYDSILNSVIANPILINKIIYNCANSVQLFNNIKQIEKTVYGEVIERTINLQNYIDPLNPNHVIEINLDTPIVINNVQYLQMDLEAYTSANIIFEYCQGTPDDVVQNITDQNTRISLNPIKGDIMYKPEIKDVLVKYSKNQAVTNKAQVLPLLIAGTAAFIIYKLLKQ